MVALCIITLIVAIITLALLSYDIFIARKIIIRRIEDNQKKQTELLCTIKNEEIIYNKILNESIKQSQQPNVKPDPRDKYRDPVSGLLSIDNVYKNIKRDEINSMERIEVEEEVK